MGGGKWVGVRLILVFLFWLNYVLLGFVFGFVLSFDKRCKLHHGLGEGWACELSPR